MCIADTPVLPGVEEAFSCQVQAGGSGVAVEWDSGISMGLIAEQWFILECMKRGLLVNQPLCGHSVYDFVIDQRGKLLKVQVKGCSKSLRDGVTSSRSLHKSSSGDKVGYEPGDWDLLAYFIEPDGNWFLMPFSAIPGGDKINLSYTGKYAQYLNDWSLFDTLVVG